MGGGKSVPTPPVEQEIKIQDVIWQSAEEGPRLKPMNGPAADQQKPAVKKPLGDVRPQAQIAVQPELPELVDAHAQEQAKQRREAKQALKQKQQQEYKQQQQSPQPPTNSKLTESVISEHTATDIQLISSDKLVSRLPPSPKDSDDLSLYFAQAEQSRTARKSEAQQLTKPVQIAPSSPEDDLFAVDITKMRAANAGGLQQEEAIDGQQFLFRRTK